MRTRFVSEYVDEQMEWVAQIMRSEKIAQDHPEDVTDKFLECLRSLKMMLGPGYQIVCRYYFASNSANRSAQP